MTFLWHYDSINQLTNIKGRVAIFVIVLDNTGHCFYNHLMEIQPVLGIFSMTEATIKDIKTFETPVARLMPVLGPGHELPELWRVLIFCQNNFFRLSCISTVTDALLSFSKLEIKGSLVPILYCGVCISTTKHCDIMH